MFFQFNLKTPARSAFIDITREVQQAVAQSGVVDGLCLVFVPHTTAGITINENADPDVPRDIIGALDHLVPWQGSYAHLEGNAAAHIKASLMGSSVTVIIREGKLCLGTWQGIFFCEFDGPRSRKYLVQIIPHQN